MTASDLESAYDRCVCSYRQFLESLAPASSPSQDTLLAQYALTLHPRAFVAVVGL